MPATEEQNRQKESAKDCDDIASAIRETHVGYSQADIDRLRVIDRVEQARCTSLYKAVKYEEEEESSEEEEEGNERAIPPLLEQWLLQDLTPGWEQRHTPGGLVYFVHDNLTAQLLG